jgi:hypothetical protein
MLTLTLLKMGAGFLLPVLLISHVNVKVQNLTVTSTSHTSEVAKLTVGGLPE